MLNVLKKILLFLPLIFYSCSDNQKLADAYGTFEADDIIISAEAQGKLLEFKAQKGVKLKANEVIGIIDTTQTYLKIQQLKAQKLSISSKNQNIISQIEIQEKQKDILLKEKKRIENLLKDSAATTKQLDDINGKIDIIESTINSIKTNSPAVFANLEAIDFQINQLEDLLNKSYITNPINGIVLENYINKYEIAFPGKPLYKIANLDYLNLRAYISGSQLSQIKLNDKVKVYIDKNKNDLKEFTGEIIWISDQAEFTPKIIQTKEERVNLVYALLISVKNDGSIKIGMPGEVRFK